MAKKPSYAQSLPWHPPHVTKEQARAIQLVALGQAGEIEQKTALKTIIDILGARDELEFRPDEFGGERGSAFMAGRRFVALQVVRWATASGKLIETLPD